MNKFPSLDSLKHLPLHQLRTESEFYSKASTCSKKKRKERKSFSSVIFFCVHNSHFSHLLSLCCVKMNVKSNTVKNITQ